MASGNGQQTALQAWQTALFAQIDAAAIFLSSEEYATLVRMVALRMERRAMP